AELRLAVEGCGQALLQLVPVRSEARLLADEDHVRVRQLPAIVPDPCPGPCEQVERIGARECGVCGGEERADVFEPGRAEQGVGQRVGEDVAVRVARQAAWMLDPNAAEPERGAPLA